MSIVLRDTTGLSNVYSSFNTNPTEGDPPGMGRNSRKRREKMSVIIVSKRNVSKDKEEAIMPLIIQLRKLAKGQPGFNSEEIWRHLEHPEEYMVVRAWGSEDEWHDWHSNQQRVEIQEKIEALLGRKTEYNPYEIIRRTEKSG